MFLGEFAVSPLSGEALNTNFKLSALEGWSDPDNDELKFQFSHTQQSGPNAEYFSSAPQKEPSLTTQLPPG